jgi:hypothetical protein
VQRGTDPGSFLIELGDSAGQVPQRHQGHVPDRVGSVAGPWPGEFGNQALVVAAEEPGPDRFGGGEDEVTDLVQRPDPLIPS